MVKYLKKIALFFALIAVIDIACGFGFDVLKKHAKGGETRKNLYIAEECEDDILILGSSRAARHYDPNVIEDSLGMTCFNCGEPGCGIITAYARYQMIAERHKPKLVIYEVTPNYDFLNSDDYSKYLGRIKQYSDNKSVKRLFVELKGVSEGYRLFSNLYKNNGFFLDNVSDLLITKEINKGFNPLYGVLNTNIQQRPSDEHLDLDGLKFSYMAKLIEELKKDSIAVVFMVSPKYMSLEEANKALAEYKPIINLCEQYNVPFFNHLYMEGLSDNSFMFQDYGHMNVNGVSKFDKVVCAELMSFLNRQN